MRIDRLTVGKSLLIVGIVALASCVPAIGGGRSSVDDLRQLEAKLTQLGWPNWVDQRPAAIVENLKFREMIVANRDARQLVIDCLKVPSITLNTFALHCLRWSWLPDRAADSIVFGRD